MTNVIDVDFSLAVVYYFKATEKNTPILALKLVLVLVF
jgi:hypothetical protein